MSKDTPHSRVSVILADGARMSCESLSYALERLAHEVSVVASVTTSRDLLQEAARHSPNVAVVSVDLEDGKTSGLLAVRQLHALYPSVGCVMLMDKDNRHLGLEAFRAGARGLVFRAEPLERLRDCIRSIFRGQIWASTAEIEEVMNALTMSFPVRALSANGDELLTHRQKQLVALVAEGLSNREISERLGLSEHTVKNYLFRVFDKLGVSSRAELIIHTLHQRNRSFV